MRYLVLLFTIYVLALLAWPCCGDETSLSSTHEDTHETSHACSPFFHCSNYHSFVASPAINKAPALIVSEQKDGLPEHHVQPVILFQGDIWQPPQLV